MEHNSYSCVICKKLAEKDHKKGVIGKHLLRSLCWFDTEEEAIRHIRTEHPRECRKAIEEGKNNEKNR